jgi:ketosteroid isomerase-like protein
MPGIGDSPDATIDAFLAAFSRLDLAAMMGHFAPRATMFPPSSHAGERLSSRAAIRECFAAIIAGVRARGATALPLHPQERETQTFGDTALVTFHLRTDQLNRRTFVLRREADRWTIIHLHASNAPLPPSSTTGT